MYNIYWVYGPMTSTYRAKVMYDGVLTPIEGTFIRELDTKVYNPGYKYELYVDFTLFIGFKTKGEAMSKGQELISDLYINRHSIYGGKVIAEPFLKPQKTTHDIVGWKKAIIFGENDSFEDVIVKLKIPKGTRCNLTTHKCRAEQAVILDAYGFNSFFDELQDPISPETSIYSAYAVGRSMRTFGLNFESAIEALDEGKGAPGSVYKVGDILTVVNFDESNESCASGIHFFRDRRRAISYRL